MHWSHAVFKKFDMMRKYMFLIALFYFSSAGAQTIIQRDAIVESMVNDVSADSLRSYIRKLVSFGTRNTLSSTTDKKRGIGAAREWVVQKFREFGKESNGRLTAYVDTTTLQADGKRVDARISLGNAMAVLKGTDPSDNRIT
jgi:hypothetical protein